MLYRCGLRIGEALALRPVDVDASAGTVRVLRGKGDKARTVGIDPQALALVELWMTRRKALGIARNRGPLFCTFSEGTKGQALDQSYVRHLLPKLAAKCGIVKRVHAHGFRHTHAVELDRERVSTATIQDVLGHANIATTNTYLAHLGARTVVETMRQRAWDGCEIPRSQDT